MRRFLFALVFMASCTATAPTSDIVVDRQTLKANISAYEGGVTAERLAALSGDVAGALMALSEDPSEKPFFRARAFQALAFYPEERVFQHLKGSLTRYQSLGFVVLPQAIQAIAAFSDRYPEEVAESLRPLLREGSLVAKEASIRVLAQNPSVEAKGLLSAMALEEKEPALQDALRAAGVLR